MNCFVRSEMGTAYMPYDYRGSGRNSLAFMRYVAENTKKGTPMVEVPFADLARAWADASGIQLKVRERTDDQGRSITQIVEEGHDPGSRIEVPSPTNTPDEPHLK